MFTLSLARAHGVPDRGGGDCLNLLQLLQQFCALRYGARLVRLRPAHGVGGIQHKDRPPVCPALIVEDAVQPADCAVRPEVGQDRERHLFELLGPDLLRVDAVNADLKDLGVQLLELFVVLTEPGDVVLSAARERGRVERNHDPAARVGAELDVDSRVSGKLEVRGLIARLEWWHLESPLVPSPNIERAGLLCPCLSTQG